MRGGERIGKDAVDNEHLVCYGQYIIGALEELKVARKSRINITLSEENVQWLKQLTEKTGIAVSLFIDSMITGTRMATKDGMTQREALSMAFEQIAKGIRKNN